MLQRVVLLFAVCFGLGCSLIGGGAVAQAFDAPNGRPQILAGVKPPPPPSAPKVFPPIWKGPVQPYGGAPIDVLTFHYDNSRAGWNASETDLTPASVNAAAGKFVVLARLKVDGSVMAQPLLVSNFVMPGGLTHDVLLVVTSLDSVYAFDAKTFALLWQVNLGPAQNATDVGCRNTGPNFGISSTPVIVRAGPGSATLYLVAATEPFSFQFHHFLHALDLGTGLDTVAPKEIAASETLSDGSTMSFDPQNQWNRPGLAYNNGSVYVALGAHCDDNPASVTGWVLRYNASLTLQSAYADIGGRAPPVGKHAGRELGSFWNSGFPPAIDAAGDVFVVAANGYYNPALQSFGQSVIKLSANLAGPPLGVYTPSNVSLLNTDDLDLGSGGVSLLPTPAGSSLPPQAVVMGKDPIVYLLDQGLGVAPLTASYRLNAPAQNGVWGGPAYFGGSSGPVLFYQTNFDVLRAYPLSSTSPYLTQRSATGTTGAGYGGSSPVVTSNGSTPGTGLVWLLRRSVPVQLEAYDASVLGAPIYVASIGNHAAFDTPLVANGRVFIGGEKQVTVFGLHP